MSKEIINEEEMREELMKLTMKQLKQICKDEGICPGWDASRKDSLVGCIITNRRHREMSTS